MPKLNELNEEISIFKDKTLKVLMQNKVTTALDFLREDLEKLVTITKLSLPEIISIRTRIFEISSAPLLNAKRIYLSDKNKETPFDTFIPSVNRLTSKCFIAGHITEISGLADSGKTQFCLQLCINCVQSTQQTVLYIDTKGDFSSVRIQKILDNNGYAHKDMVFIMSQIKVIRIWNMEDINVLLDQLEKEVLVIDNLSLIVVDSLPCLMFQYLGDECKIGLTLLNIFVNKTRSICKKFKVSFICVNIVTRWVEQDISDIEDIDNEAIILGEGCWKETKSRCLGKYWQHIPAVVLNLEKYSKSSSDEPLSSTVTVTVTKSILNKCEETCDLVINPLGCTALGH